MKPDQNLDDARDRANRADDESKAAHENLEEAERNSDKEADTD